MLRLRIASHDSAVVAAHHDEIISLIASSRLKLGSTDVARFFRPGYDFALAFAGPRLVGVTVMTRFEDTGEVFIGYRLAVIDPAFRGRGLLGRLATRYFVRELPRIITDYLLRPNHRTYLFADLSSPLSYHRLHIGQKIYPDLKRGTPIGRAPDLSRLRVKVARLAELRTVDPASGLIEDGASSAVAIDSQRAVDRDWRIPWHAYVPPGRDLLVIVPVELMQLLKCFIAVAQLVVHGRNQRLRLRPAAGRGSR